MEPNAATFDLPSNRQLAGNDVMKVFLSGRVEIEALVVVPVQQPVNWIVFGPHHSRLTLVFAVDCVGLRIWAAQLFLWTAHMGGLFHLKYALAGLNRRTNAADSTH